MIAALLILALQLAPLARHGCHVIPPGDVVTVESGFVVLSTGDLVWYDDAKESGDREFWGCWLSGTLDALYVPPDQMKRPKPHGSPHLHR